MKKSQRLRFYALVAKQSEGKALSDTESADLKTLSTLAAAHPNSSDDTDDTKKDETEEEKKKREEKEKKDKEDADKKTADEEAAKAKAALKPGVSARLAAAMASLGGGTPAQAAADLAAERTAHGKTTADLTQARADLDTTKASLKSTETALGALCDFLGLKPADIAGKTQADIDGICTAKIGAAAISQVTSLGFSPGKLPAPNASSTGDSKLMTKAEFDALTPSKKMEFSVKGGRLTD